MRATADRRLPEPYRSWIDRAAPLPAGVQVLPRTVRPGYDGIVFLALALPMGAMGVFFASLALLPLPGMRRPAIARPRGPARHPLLLRRCTVEWDTGLSQRNANDD